MSKQKLEKHIALNTHLIICLIFSLVFPCLSVFSALDNQIGFCILFAIFTLLPIFVFTISPLYYIFSDEGVEIIYNFGQKEYIPFKLVKNIYLSGSWITYSRLPHYTFVYPKKEKTKFYIVGEIAKTRKTKKLIEKYYKKEIK